ncbi:hypothetical protein HZC34_05410 [Candidatus Saganbacteria bacterium]|nr:hypothetical protein [Candidatus Saganbacteria bacterium]
MLKRGLLLLTALVCAVCPVFGQDQIQIKFIQQPNTPYFAGQPEISIYAGEYDTVNLRIKSEKSGTARLFWATDFDPNFNQQKSIWFFIDRSVAFKEYTFNLRSQNKYWAGLVGQLVVFPENGLDGFTVAQSNAAAASISSNISSGWRELWGPRGRLIEGPSINNMQANYIFGIPINYYIYFSILLVGFSAFLCHFIISKDLAYSLKIFRQAAIFACVGFLGLISIWSLNNQWLQLKGDFRIFGFRSLEEKQAAFVGKEFYGFLSFIKANVPQRAKVEMLQSSQAYGSEIASYYLYPLNFYLKPADYILVFHYQKDLGQVLNYLKDYYLFKKQSDQAYILRRK